MSDERDEMPVMMVIDIDNYLVAVGEPRTFKPKDIASYANEGYTIKTVKFKEYIAMNLKWIYSKPQLKQGKLL